MAQRQLQVSDLPVFTHPCLYAGDFNCPHVDWGYNTNSADGDCLLTWASSNNLALLDEPKDEPSFYSGAGTLVLTRILPLPQSVLIVACLVDAFWRSFLGHNIDLRLYHHQGFPSQYRKACKAMELPQGQLERL